MDKRGAPRGEVALGFAGPLMWEWRSFVKLRCLACGWRSRAGHGPCQWPAGVHVYVQAMLVGSRASSVADGATRERERPRWRIWICPTQPGSMLGAETRVLSQGHFRWRQRARRGEAQACMRTCVHDKVQRAETRAGQEQTRREWSANGDLTVSVGVAFSQSARRQQKAATSYCD